MTLIQINQFLDNNLETVIQPIFTNNTLENITIIVNWVSTNIQTSGYLGLVIYENIIDNLENEAPVIVKTFYNTCNSCTNKLSERFILEPNQIFGYCKDSNTSFTLTYSYIQNFLN